MVLIALELLAQVVQDVYPIGDRGAMLAFGKSPRPKCAANRARMHGLVGPISERCRKEGGEVGLKYWNQVISVVSLPSEKKLSYEPRMSTHWEESHGWKQCFPLEASHEAHLLPEFAEEAFLQR